MRPPARALLLSLQQGVLTHFLPSGRMFFILGRHHLANLSKNPITGNPHHRWIGSVAGPGSGK